MLSELDARRPCALHGAFFFLVVLFGTVPTFINGATQHVPAFFLRLGVLLLVVALWPRSGAVLRARALIAPLVAFIIVSVGVLLAPNSGLAQQPWVSCGLVGLLYVCLLASTEDATPWLLRGCGMLAVAHSVIAFWQRVAHGARGAGGFFNPLELSAYLAPLFVLGLTATLHATGRSRRMLSAATACLAVGLWATGSRAAVLGAALGAGCLCLPAIRRHPAWAAVPLGLLSAALVLLRARWLDTTDPYAYSRWQIWRQSVSAAWPHPLGNGLANYAETLRVVGVPIDDWVRYPHVANHAHNEVLQAWVELGIPGLIAVFLPVAVVLRLIARQSPSERAGSLGVLMAFTLPALTGASLHVPAVAFLAAVWAASIARHDSAEGLQWPLSSRLPWLGAILLVAAIPGALGVGAMQWAAYARDTGDMARAQTLAEVGRDAMPWSLGAEMLAASLRYQTGEPAVQVAEDLVALGEHFPEQPDMLIRAGQLLASEAGTNPERWRVIAHLRDGAAHRDPRNALAWYDLGMAYKHTGDTAAAAEAFARAISEEPHCARALMQLAELTPDEATATALRQAATLASEQAKRYRGYAASILTLDHQSEKIVPQP